MSQFPHKYSHYQLPIRKFSASETPKTSPSQWVATSSSPVQRPFIEIPATDTFWTTQANTPQRISGKHKNNQLPVPDIGFVAIEPPGQRSGIVHEQLPSILQNDLREGTSARHPGSGRSNSPRGSPGGPRQGSAQRSEVNAETRLHTNTISRDSGRDTTASLAARTNHSLQCPECPKSFKWRHELKYVLPLMERWLTLLINISIKHLKTHNRSFKCTKPGCTFRVCYRLQDLDRHNSSSHRKGDDQIRTFCEFSDCPMAGKGFSRRDNYVRHARRQHRASLDSRVS